MTYRQPPGVSGELLLASRSVFRNLEVYQAVEDGLVVAYRPFALRLPAGSTKLVSFDTRWLEIRPKQETRWREESYTDHQGNRRTRIKTETVTVQDHVPVGKAANLPANGFEVAVGKVRYIGRVGMVVHAERPLEAPCVLGRREELTLFSPSYCLVRAPFMENREVTDLAMIRQHFPGLAGVEIEVRPLQTAPGSWQTLSEAVRAYAAGR